MAGMAHEVPTRLTAQEWERIEDDEHVHELVEGVLIVVPPESPLNAFGGGRLLGCLFMASAGPDGQRFQVGTATQVDTTPPDATYPTYRVTDLTVIRAEADIRGRTVPPSDLLLAIEIVSPASVATDYIHKRAEYAIVGVPAYLIVDFRPGHERLLLLTLGSDGTYAVAADDDQITLRLAGADIPLSIADLIGR